MGIKGTVRRNQDSHVIHSNVDTDIIVAEEFPFGSTRKPDEMYSVIEHFCLVRCPEFSALLVWHAAFPVACLPGVQLQACCADQAARHPWAGAPETNTKQKHCHRHAAGRAARLRTWTWPTCVRVSILSQAGGLCMQSATPSEAVVCVGHMEIL